jgi:riboflavin synthase
LFTGIILEMGEILSLKKISGGAVLSLQSDHVAPESQIGDSISLNGVCLTVVRKKGKEVSFDLSDETLQRSNLGKLKKGDRINLEPSLNPTSKIGGHFVTGHIDTTGKIRLKSPLGDMLKFEIEVPEDIADFLVEKGSVAVDGISLTVVDILKKSFTTVIIPHTAKVTTLGSKGSGDTVNIEVDILGKYVAKFLKREKRKDSKFMKSLINEGYLT